MIRFTSISSYPQGEQALIVQPRIIDPVPPKKPRKPCKRRLYDRAELADMRARGLSYPQIGQIFNKHHTTILYYLRKDAA